ncbi:ABC transporter substrate-binding protein [Sinomonas sp. P10A9]|uniref:ABC transporter substrate-binding protein n=1 Tax=Sinomonas puerhi TaxID=3238584 RepID=A0AB39KZD6_9MICC
MPEEVTGRAGRLRRRSFLVGAAALPFLLTGCLDKSSALQASPAESGAFPVEIPHVFGMTRISSAPKRVAVLGSSSADVCAGLGILPVGYSLAPERGQGTAPWLTDAVGKMNAILPPAYVEDQGLPTTELTAARPDLILAVNAKFTRDEYHKLSGIAPTVAWPARPADTDWRTLTRVVGKSLGRAQAAEDLVNRVDSEIVAAAGAYTGLQGSSVLCIGARSAPGSGFEVYLEDSNPMRVLKDFGLKPADSLVNIVAQGKPADPGFGPKVVLWDSARAAELRADIVVVAVQPGERLDILNNGVLGSIPAARRESIVVIGADTDMYALTAASPASVEWTLKTLLPELARSAYRAKGGK